MKASQVVSNQQQQQPQQPQQQHHERQQNKMKKKQKTKYRLSPADNQQQSVSCFFSPFDLTLSAQHQIQTIKGSI